MSRSSAPRPDKPGVGPERVCLGCSMRFRPHPYWHSKSGRYYYYAKCRPCIAGCNSAWYYRMSDEERRAYLKRSWERLKTDPVRYEQHKLNGRLNRQRKQGVIKDQQELEWRTELWDL